MTMNLLLTGSHVYSDDQLSQLKSFGYELHFQKDESSDLSTAPETIDAVVCTNLFRHHDLSLFTRLQVIQLTRTGLDGLPLESIRERGIRLYNARDVYSIPIAEWIILKILEIYKKSREFYQQQDKRLWFKQRKLFELTGKTATIVGYGSIGREVAKRLKPFGVKIIGIHRRPVDPEHLDELVMIGDLDETLAVSDIVILTIPITDETRHLIDRERINQMKPGAVLINIARGALIDEAALTDAVKAGRFMGVALDVFEKEPLDQDSPFWGMEKVLITPHNSFLSEQVNDRLFERIVGNLDPSNTRLVGSV